MKKSMFITEGNWYKGNMHAHSTVSDGRVSPEERAKQYREAGYSFLALTDHNVFASYPEYCTDDFLMIPATERDAPDPEEDYYCIHAVGFSEKPIPDKVQIQLPEYTKNRINKPWQGLLDEMHDAGQLIILAHPVWSRNTPEEFIALNGYIGIEVYNNLCEISGHTGKADYFIDCCLRAGKKAFLFAQDDCHSIPSPVYNNGNDICGGWIQVKAKELTHEAIVDAIKQGSFYASTGPEIYDYGINEEGRIYVECSPCEEIHFVAYKCRGGSTLGHDLTGAEYEPQGEQSYVRCECIDKQGKIAYTNPIYL